MKQSQPLLNRFGVRAVLIAAAGASLLLGGCFENTEPDGRLATVTNPHKLWQPMSFNQEYVLVLTNHFDSNRSNIDIISLARENIDSALVNFEYGKNFSEFQPNISGSYMQRLEWIRDLGPGKVVDWGTLPLDQFDHRNTPFHVTLLRYSEGIRRGSSFGGLYTGEYSALDREKYRYYGSVHGTIDADGMAWLYFQTQPESGRGFTGQIIGLVDSLGGLRWRVVPIYGHESRGMSNKPASFVMKDSSLSASMAFTDSDSSSQPWLDSLSVVLRPTRQL